MKDINTLASTSAEDTRENGSLPSKAMFVQIFQQPETM
jgi:hypothetical protein